MNILIAEDEIGASRNLIAILEELEPQCNILAVLESVQETTKWIKNNPPPDIAFFDIQLSDDIVFKVFKKTEVNFPVVFATAYNKYAIRAFKVNSIDYILKPVNRKSVKHALRQFKQLMEFNLGIREERILNMLEDIKSGQNKQYKKSFLVQFKDRLIPIGVSDLAYFFIEHDVIYGITTNNQKYAIDQNLEDIANQLDPEIYFRANRQFIISRQAVKEINPYFNERLSIKLSPQAADHVIISKARATSFKAWIRG